jgi:hypothetical protein
MKIIKLTLIFGVIILGFSSCKKDYEKKMSATYPISGDWSVIYTYGGTDYGPYVLSIYNTSFGGADTVWVNDNGNFWEFTVKAKADVPNNSFQINQGTDTWHNDTTTIMNGRIINNDSIHFLLMFVSSPGDTITVAGHRRTGFE